MFPAPEPRCRRPSAPRTDETWHRCDRTAGISRVQRRLLRDVLLGSGWNSIRARGTVEDSRRDQLILVVVSSVPEPLDGPASPPRAAKCRLASRDAKERRFSLVTQPAAGQYWGPHQQPA